MASEGRPPHRVDWEPPAQWRSHPHAELAPPPDGRVRASWTRVLLLGVGAFALWFLVFAPTLQHDAQVSPVGARRTASLDVTGPVAALSRGLQVSRIVSATGRSDRLPGGSIGLDAPGPAVTHGEGGHGAPGAAANGSTPGSGDPHRGSTPTTAPPDPKAPTGAHPLRVLIVGDSIGLDMGGQLQSDLAGTGGVAAALDARERTGLTRPDYFDWPAELARDLQAVQPQVVVIMIGANDAQDFLGPPDVPFTSPQWNTLYAQRVGQFLRVAGSGGAAVLWVGMPPMENAELNSQMQGVNAVAQRQAAAARPAATFVSTDKTLGDAQGGYTAFVTNPAGQVIDARTPDGTHLTPGGGQMVAQQVLGEMRNLGYRIP